MSSDVLKQNPVLLHNEENEDLAGSFEVINQTDVDEEEEEPLDTEEALLNAITKLEFDFQEWTSLRRDTIQTLHNIADYVDMVSKRGGMVRAVGSGSGVVAGGLTLVGGILTIASAGIATVPILIAGAGLGLAAGVTGGAAAVTEKVIKSKQMSAARTALKVDQDATEHLEHRVEKLKKDKRVVRKIASDVLLTGSTAAYDSVNMFNLLAGKGGAAASLKVGIEATAQLFGEDFGKEVSKILLHTSGRLLSGTVTVVLGGATMIYDIYKLTTEVEEIAKLGKDGASEIRTIAQQLEAALSELVPSSETKR